MMTNYSITPPPELVQEWYENTKADTFWIKDHQESFATRAARWGADQELEACCQALYDRYDSVCHATGFPGSDMSDWLRAARRPKPPSLKEQALEVLGNVQKGWGLAEVDLNTIRLALEQLND